jgi:alkylation response protein AidB-like acyl-CoA dehydrogenase
VSGTLTTDTEDAVNAVEPAVESTGYEELAARFRPIFDRIAEGAAERENGRRIAYEEVGWLRDAGFGAVRIPVELGGGGSTLSQLFRLLIELGAADSNITQGLRAHFGFVESRLHDPDSDRRDLWDACSHLIPLVRQELTHRASRDIVTASV